MNELINPVFQTSKKPNLSDVYKFIDSGKLISNLEERGLSLSNIAFNKKAKNQGFQRHKLIFNSPNLKINDENNFQLLVINSHDSSESLKISLGIFRLVCSNGLILGKSVFNYRIKHVGDVQDKINQSVDDLWRRLPELKLLINEMSTIEAKTEHKDFLINQVKTLRGLNETDVIPNFFQPKRFGDAKNDLYTVFNIAQENLIRGFKYLDENNNNCYSRKITSVKTDYHFNSTLFENTLNYLNLK